MRYTLKNKEIELTDEEVQEIVKQNSEPKGIEIKNRFTGQVIYSSTKENIKKAVEEAVSQGADLWGADLRRADLRGVNLWGADLRRADLQGADMWGADLRGAGLWGADLEGADLQDAELRGAFFYGRGGRKPLKRDQLPGFLGALGFIIED